MNTDLIFFSFYCYITKTYVISIREPPLRISQPSELGNNSDIKTFWYNLKRLPVLLRHSQRAQNPHVDRHCMGTKLNRSSVAHTPPGGSLTR